MRQRKQPVQTLPTNEQKKPPKTNSDRFKTYYGKLKADDKKYKTFLEAKRLAVKEYYAYCKRNDTEDIKQRKKQANRLRVKKCREKKKQLGVVPEPNTPTTSKPLTRKEKEKVFESLLDSEKEKILKFRKKDAERKKLARASWSEAKKKKAALQAKNNRIKRAAKKKGAREAAQNKRAEGLLEQPTETE